MKHDKIDSYKVAKCLQAFENLNTIISKQLQAESKFRELIISLNTEEILYCNNLFKKKMYKKEDKFIDVKPNIKLIGVENEKNKK